MGGTWVESGPVVDARGGAEGPGSIWTMLAFGLPPRTVLVGGIGTAIGATLSTSTVVQALVLGVLTVAIAPLLTLRRTRRMDIPSTLRVME